MADSCCGWIRQLASRVAQRTGEVSQTVSDHIDKVVLNRWLDIPIFLLVMYALFLVTINVGGAFIDFFDIAAGTIFVDGFCELLGALNSSAWLAVVLVGGTGAGIQTVATLTSIIGVLFLFLVFLEDSGYMARAAFVMDRFMRFVRLPGKSFVPMLIGFGCNVPATMATRTLGNHHDRHQPIIMNSVHVLRRQTARLRAVRSGVLSADWAEHHLCSLSDRHRHGRSHRFSAEEHHPSRQHIPFRDGVFRLSLTHPKGVLMRAWGKASSSGPGA